MVGAIATIIIKKNYNKKYFYRFYEDRLEYRNTFSNKVKEVKYTDFKEVRYNQGYMQSKFNLGELWILTNNKNILKRMLMFKSIPNIEQEYERIIKIFNT